MKVGDLVRWRMGEHVSPIGIVIEVKSLPDKTGKSILAYFDGIKSIEWFHEIELEKAS